MLSWLFKKLGGLTAAKSVNKPTAKPVAKAAAKASAATAPAVKVATPAALNKAELKNRQIEADRAIWAPRWQAALGNEAALLHVVLNAPVLELKLSALEHLRSEDSLKQVEREFRSHDRRVHQVAKRRLDAAVTQRQTRARAQALIEAAQALAAEALIPANRLASLDRDWQALDAALLAPEQAGRFAELSRSLSLALRQRSELEQSLQRWASSAPRVLAEQRSALALATADGDAAAVAACQQALQTLQDDCPDVPSSAALYGQVVAALQVAAAVQARLLCLAHTAAVSTASADDAAPTDRTDNTDSTDNTETTERTVSTKTADPAATWAALPPLADAELSAVLTQRWVQLQKSLQKSSYKAQLPGNEAATAALAEALPEASSQALSHPLPRTRSPAYQSAGPVLVDAPAASAAQQAALELLMAPAEAALAEGQLSEMQRHLLPVDEALKQLAGATLAEPLRERLQQLQAERQRLRGWEQWGDGLALDGLLDEALALARLTLAAAPENAPPAAEPVAQMAEVAELAEVAETAETAEPAELGEAAEAAAPIEPAEPSRPAIKLNLHQHREAIQQLRQRWKELERQGAQAAQALWPRFDAALQVAYRPLAAQQVEQKAQREDNLAARELLLTALDAVPVAFAETDGGLTAAGLAQHWKEQMRALSAFQLAWRPLGPIEHTVPAAARSALQTRLRASLERLEAPLQAARRVAEAEREQFILRAEACAEEQGAGGSARDAMLRLRELQTEWQEHARSLPLSRPAEAALWTRFKAATDAAFQRRDAVFSARDAQANASLQARELLLERLIALADDAPEAELQRTLGEVDRAWRAAEEVPRAAVSALDARYRAARAGTVMLLAHSAQQRWLQQCDRLALKVSLCEQREQAAAVAVVGADDGADVGSDGAEPDTDLVTRWATVPALPAVWEQALEQRWSRVESEGPLSAPAFDDVLLQLEVALDLPATPAWQAARHQLKLRALKDALEGGQRTAPTPAADKLLALMRQRGLNPAQRERLQALLLALRRATAGALGAPVLNG